MALSFLSNCIGMLFALVLIMSNKKTHIGVDGYVMMVEIECDYTKDNMEDMVLNWRYIFNKKEIVHYDTNIKEFAGYTECGVRNAAEWSKDKARLAGYLAAVERYCKYNFGVFKSSTLDRRVPPTVRISSSKQPGLQNPNILICYVMGFYPQEVNITWLKNGVETPEVKSSQLLPDGDWSYQTHMYLELPHKAGDTYTCKVEHSSLQEPIRMDWDPSMPESDRNKVIIGASGLVLGLIIAAAGGMYYKKKSSGRILVPTN
ncbi:SLA class II histocompatibility antigen, DQ haplotype C beta chain [Amia ocellicauda]|uniref:SLA class II histocompatibility antigen, DQ haplotype C beta chain n=1 Tax=Amia ocellicauda TaxID=2972642 RepID=UPI00346455A2